MLVKDEFGKRPYQVVSSGAGFFPSVFGLIELPFYQELIQAYHKGNNSAVDCLIRGGIMHLEDMVNNLLHRDEIIAAYLKHSSTTEDRFGLSHNTYVLSLLLGIRRKKPITYVPLDSRCDEEHLKPGITLSVKQPFKGPAPEIDALAEHLRRELSLDLK